MHSPAAPAVLLSVVVVFLGAACSPASPTPVSGSVSVEGPESGQPVPAVSGATYRLNGSILDAASGDPVPGARVEASVDANGSLPPIAVATAGSDGRYSLSGVPALSDLRVTHDGYVPTTTRVELMAHHGQNFSIAWDTSAYDFAGAYTLTIEANDACPSAPNGCRPISGSASFPRRFSKPDPDLVEHLGGDIDLRTGIG